MKMMDCVEVVVEKTEYSKEGVHKGMQGVIWEEACKDGRWVVLFPQCGEKEDIADLYVKEEDLVLLPHGMDARVNESIKAEHDRAAQTETGKNASHHAGNLSGYMI